MALTTHHFKGLVETETKKFHQLCDQWLHVMDNESNIPEEAIGQIRSTIGKTNLFINQRFKQFNGLIDDCELKRGVKETKVEDLQGFWEMIFYQIEDLHHSFELLTSLKENKWCELEVNPKPIASKSSKVVPKLKTTKPIVRSKIREQILNMKSKTIQPLVQKNESFGEKENQKISSPVKSEVMKKLGTNDKCVDKHSESITEVRNVLKRTPLRVALKKWTNDTIKALISLLFFYFNYNSIYSILMKS